MDNISIFDHAFGSLQRIWPYPSHLFIPRRNEPQLPRALARGSRTPLYLGFSPRLSFENRAKAQLEKQS